MPFEVLEDPTGKPVTAKADADGIQRVEATVPGGATAASQALTNSYVDGVEDKLDTLAANVATTDTRFVSNGAAASATVKGSAGTLYGVYARNDNASATLYLWLADSLSAGGTLLMAPVKLVAGAQVFIDQTYFTSDGHVFSTGFTWGFSTTPLTYAAHATVADCIISGLYK
jgi:hypothetical protein